MSSNTKLKLGINETILINIVSFISVKHFIVILVELWKYMNKILKLIPIGMSAYGGN